MIIIVYSFLVTGELFWTLHTYLRRGESRIGEVVYELLESIWTIL